MLDYQFDAEKGALSYFSLDLDLPIRIPDILSDSCNINVGSSFSLILT